MKEDFNLLREMIDSGPTFASMTETSLAAKRSRLC